MKKRFNPIKDKSSEIIEYLMASPDIPKDEALEFKIRLSVEEAVDSSGLFLVVETLEVHLQKTGMALHSLVLELLWTGQLVEAQHIQHLTNFH